MNAGVPDARVIDDRFALLERLGGGGMGWVWRARDLALHREVAVKEVRPSDPGLAEYDPEAARVLRERVLREARALARVHHPNVVAIHHIVDGGEGTFPWLVTELVTGGSLQDRLDRGTMTPREAARLGREVLAALRAAHAAGIEHRDVKPANVLLRPDGRPVLTDFGIAALREQTSLTATGSVIGSPDYMAPERVSGKESGPAADLWSLAMLLYVAVEGHHPLRRSSTLATLAAVLSEDVPPPRQAGPLTPLLTALLVKDPQARPDAETTDHMLAEAHAGHTAVAAPGNEGGPVPPATGPVPAASGPVPADSAPVSPVAGAVSAAPGPLPPAVGPVPPAADSAPPASGPVRPAGDAPVPPTSYHLSPPAPAPWPSVPPVTVGPLPPPPSGRRPTRRSRVPAVAAAVAGVALTGVLVWTLLPGGTSGSDGTTGSGGPVLSSAPSASGGATPAADGSAAAVDLLTAEGLRATVEKLKAAMGGSEVTSLVVYGEYALAEAPVKGNPKLYDRYRYDGGEVAVKDGPGGTVTGGKVPVDLDTYDWDAVPGLFAEAERTLNVPSPSIRYLLIDPASTVFHTDPTMNVYLSDDYGAAYLKATVDGKVIRAYPREG
ncbi:protein kinase [Streptomyces sp. NPDC018693]|uniref:serine/threonine-protein kinase n=1 Tax=unclassified Streptomyces TaxID=2593676 RepID=UPI0037A0D4CE